MITSGEPFPDAKFECQQMSFVVFYFISTGRRSLLSKGVVVVLVQFFVYWLYFLEQKKYFWYTFLGKGPGIQITHT